MIKPRLSSAIVLLALLSTSCTKSKTKGVKSSERAAYGSALVEISGGKQAAPVGSTLDQPVVVQVNDDKGTAVSNVAVHFNGPAGALFNPTMVLTDSSRQASTALSMGSAPGRYRIEPWIQDRSGKRVSLALDAIAYPDVLSVGLLFTVEGSQLNPAYSHVRRRPGVKCIR